MNLSNILSQFGRAVAQAAADHQQQSGVKRPSSKKNEPCTPCAAEAAVRDYHRHTQKKARRK